MQSRQRLSHGIVDDFEVYYEIVLILELEVVVWLWFKKEVRIPGRSPGSASRSTPTHLPLTFVLLSHLPDSLTLRHVKISPCIC